MNEQEIKHLSDNGFEIGSHTLTHPALTRIDKERFEQELAESKKQLEEEYDIIITSLAFPYHDYDKEVLKFYGNSCAVFGCSNSQL